jgi:release factor glutamine methyltransferase
VENHQTIAQALKSGTALLKPYHDIAALEAELLLCHCLDKSRAYLRTWPEKLLDRETLERYKQLLQRRQQGEPFAYITGQKEFWDLQLRVTPNVLIPRPETEHLVELTLDKIPTDAHWHIADLGTGSGAIGLAIAKQRPNCRITATDKSPAALEIARHNASTNGIRNIQFVLSAWFEALGNERFHLIASNPPYVAKDDPHLQQGDLRFEPHEALSSGPEGLDDIQHIISQAATHLMLPGWLLLEHGYQQGDAVPALLRQYGFTEVQCHSDYAQRERVSMGRIGGG